MVVMNSPPYSDFLDGGNVTLGNGPAETVILTRATTLPAGNNVVIAAVQLDNTSNAAPFVRNITAGNLRLRRGVGGPVLASNLYAINLARRTLANRGIGVLLLASDAGAPANATYTVTGIASAINVIDGEAKLLVLNGVPSAFVSGSDVATLGIVDTTVRTLPTGFVAGENVVIAAAQYENSGAGAGTPRTIATPNEQIVTGGLSQSSNSFDLDFCSGTAECDDLTTGLVWAQPSAPANASYEFHGRASAANSIRPEVKLLAIHLGMLPAAWSIDRQELFP
jgi:precorrin-6B methylase 2